MTIYARDSGQNRMARAHVRDSDNTLVNIGAIRVRDMSGLYDLLNTFSARGPAEQDGFGNSAKPIQITTGVAAVTAVGGTPPYTYSWSIGSGWSATAPTAPSSAFRSPTISAGDSASTTATCTVTDSESNIAVVGVSVTCTNNA